MQNDTGIIAAELQKLADHIKQVVDRLGGAQSQRQLPPEIISKISSGVTVPPIIKVYEQSYDGHYFLTAPSPLQKNMETYILERPVDMMILQANYDYQFEIDREVTTSTPVIDAHIYSIMPIKATKKITYKISQTVLEQLGDSITGNFNIFLYWYNEVK